MRNHRQAIIASIIAIASASCSTAPTVTGCSELARGVLTTATPYPSLNAETDPLVYGAEATGALTKANDDKRTGFAIINGCEKRDAEIVAKLNRPVWRFW